MNVVRWPVVALVMLVSIGLLYRLSVGHVGRWFGIVSEGSLIAMVGWLVLSILFAFYTANFASYAKTYGSLATIVVLLLWLWLERARGARRRRVRRRELDFRLNRRPVAGRVSAATRRGRAGT